jgi:hypothetical protein
MLQDPGLHKHRDRDHLDLNKQDHSLLNTDQLQHTEVDLHQYLVQFKPTVVVTRAEALPLQRTLLSSLVEQEQEQQRMPSTTTTTTAALPTSSMKEIATMITASTSTTTATIPCINKATITTTASTTIMENTTTLTMDPIMVTDMMTTMIRKLNTAVTMVMINQPVIRNRQPRTSRRVTIRTRTPDAVAIAAVMIVASARTAANAAIVASVKIAVIAITAAVMTAVAEMIRMGVVAAL